MCEHDALGIQNTGVAERHYGQLAELLHECLRLGAIFAAVGVKSGVVTVSQIHGATPRLRNGVKEMLQADPDNDIVVISTVPVAKKLFVCIQCLEIIMVGMLGYIWHKDGANAEVDRGRR